MILSKVYSDNKVISEVGYMYNGFVRGKKVCLFLGNWQLPEQLKTDHVASESSLLYQPLSVASHIRPSLLRVTASRQRSVIFLSCK